LLSNRRPKFGPNSEAPTLFAVDLHHDGVLTQLARRSSRNRYL
jgi:hypothetical protein